MVQDASGGRSDDPRDARHLGEFLRSRRERVSPEAVGLPGGGRRRTPGLRREELAMLAGISVDYLIRLEQGRESRPSHPVLTALAEALRLDGDERAHLKMLAGLTANPELCPSWRPSSEPVAPSSSTLVLLDRLDPTPAFVLDHTTDVVAWNQAYEQVMAPAGLFDLDPPNLLRYTFLSPRSRTFFREWAATAREQVANLRSVMPQVCGDSAVAAIVGELSMNSSEFARLWATLDVAEKRRGRKHLDHPEVGDLTLDFEALLLPEPGLQRLVTYLPADEASARALDRLVASVEAGPASDPTRHLRLVDDG